MGNHKKLIHFLRPDSSSALSSSTSPRSTSSHSDDDGSSSSSSFPASASSSPSRHSSPKSPWAAHLPGLGAGAADSTTTTGSLVASLVKEGGKVYSLAVSGDVLYTGTDSETVRVWRDGRELSRFRTGSGLVKAVVVSRDGRVFTGHQDGKVRVWRADAANPAAHRRLGSLPSLADLLLTAAASPSSYVGLAGRRRAGVRHSDAVSCLSLDEPAGLLYSASWDRTLKVWRLADSRCLESIPAHADAVNTVAAAGFGGLVLTGSADGTVKVWRREQHDLHAGGDRTRHVLERVLREGGGEDGAATAVAACADARAVYVGASDGLVTWWRWGLDGEQPRQAGVLAGHGGMAVMCLAVSGRVVASGSADGTVCVWRRDGDDVRGPPQLPYYHLSHVRLAVLAGHTGPVKCVAVAADDDGYADDGGEERRQFVVYSGSLDGSVKVWRLSEDRALEAPPPAVEEPMTTTTTTAPRPLVPPLRREQEAWTTTPRRLRAPPALPSPVQPWAPPELKRVAAA